MKDVSKDDIALAVALISKGELVAFPTETVYGLGADASNAEAVAKIFKAKGRPNDHPVIVHLANRADISSWARDIPEKAWQLADAFWPGPLTLILKKQQQVLDSVTGNQDSVGLRVPSHPVAQELLQAFKGGKGGIAAPSANRFGHISPTKAEHVRADFADSLPLILDGGDSEVGLESTIVDLTGVDLTGSVARVLRPGGISIAALQAVIPEIEFVSKKQIPQDNQVRASGLLDKHYAPKVKTYLIEDLSLVFERFKEDTLVANKTIGVIACTSSKSDTYPTQFWINLSSEPKNYAQQLYSSMRELEEQVDEIWIEAVPQEKAWLAVLDRLRRATEPLN